MKAEAGSPMRNADRGGSPIALIVAAAGRGERMGGTQRKPFLELARKPILFHTLEKFYPFRRITQKILAVHPEDVQSVQSRWEEQLRRLYGVTAIIAGGCTRTDTIWNCLQAVREEKNQIILIHDGVRPFVQGPVIEGVVAAVELHGAAIAAVPATATLKLVDGENRIHSTLDRSKIWLAQTPQGFSRQVIMDAYSQARSSGFVATDDAAMVERLGMKVVVVPDRPDNIKITTPEDLALAEAILAWYGRAGGS